MRCSAALSWRLPERVIPVTRALPHWPKLRISAAQEAGVRNGTALPYEPEAMAQLPFAEGLKAIMLAPDDTPVALAETRIVNAQPVWTVLRGLWSQ